MNHEATRMTKVKSMGVVRCPIQFSYSYDSSSFLSNCFEYIFGGKPGTELLSSKNLPPSASKIL